MLAQGWSQDLDPGVEQDVSGGQDPEASITVDLRQLTCAHMQPLVLG